MRRYALSEMILRQLIREEVRGFSYAGIGIGSSTEAQKTSYITIAAKALGFTLGVAAALYVKGSWDTWTKNIKDYTAEAVKIKNILTTAATTFNNMPNALSLANLANYVPGTSTPTTPAPATPAAPAAPQQEYRSWRGNLIAEDITKSYRVIKTDYGDLVDTNAIELLSSNVKAITGSGAKIIPQLNLDNLKLANLDKILENILPSVKSALEKIDNLTNKSKDPVALANKFGFSISGANALKPVEGETDARLLLAQKGIANAFMYDAISVLIYDRMCNEVLENIARIVNVKDRIVKNDSDEQMFDEKMKNFGTSWIALLKSELTAFAQKILSGEVFKE